MQLHAQAQAANLAVSGPPSLPPGLPPGALGLPPGLQASFPHGLPPTSLPSSLLASLPGSLAMSLGGGHNPLHPALGMLKPQLPLDTKREEDVRKSLSESNGKTTYIWWSDLGLSLGPRTFGTCSYYMYILYVSILHISVGLMKN